MAENQYPFDLEKLQRGDFFSRETIEALMPEAQRLGEKAYEWFLMALRSKIESEFDDRGDKAWVKHEGDGLRILTHAEQSVWCAKRNASLRRGLQKGTEYLFAVDARSFTAAEKQEHERRLIIEGRYFQARQAVAKRLVRQKIDPKLDTRTVIPLSLPSYVPPEVEEGAA